MKIQQPNPLPAAGGRILFANFPADGHFNPLTGLAVYLKVLGYDVRWYSSKSYGAKLKKLDIHHYPFKKAIDVEGNNFDEVFPERLEKKTQIGRLKFDMVHAFILRGPEYYADIMDIHRDFRFDLLIADCTFTGLPFVKDLMRKPVISIGVMPLVENSRDLPPPGLGMQPASSIFGKMFHAFLRKITDRMIFGEPNRVMWQVLDNYKVKHNKTSIFDLQIKKSDYFLQSGSPGFEYFRSDISKQIKYIGALLPYKKKSQLQPWFDERLNQYSRVVLVTQGTVEKNVEKLIVPVLKAYADSDTLVVATTGGSGTIELRKRFTAKNLIIEDFIPFEDIMPYADLYITNGGYGGVMLGIQHELPLIVAGVHEGKNEINARIDYFNLGINLNTETPSEKKIRNAVNKVLADEKYRNKVRELARELNSYQPGQLCAEYVRELLAQQGQENVVMKKTEKVY